LSKLKYRGVSITNGSETLIIPPLSLGQVEELADTVFAKKIIAGEQKDAHEIMKERIPVALEAVRRNYPDYTEEQFRDFVTLKIFPEIWRAACGTSEGVETQEVGE
jgi:hypothetical protein